ncbi:hypothetical protein [Cryptosporangium phraense]|uniref:Uncharacterized protein n=1 Tax=Cryptosporangium phraense TaxID=2593070 RepID=A0A545AF04_9ACTN|nr:hypothetical protein [Cryptosporangium phraense]TQS39840.1 hypothetical protein FL583_37780 [Cryptosporangium phraense]
MLGLIDAIAQTPSVRSFLVGGPLTQPPWLGGAFDASTRLTRATAGLPDPLTTWVTANGAAAVAGRLAAVPLLLLACVALVRRGGTASWAMAAKTAAGWVGTLVAVLLAARYLATGFQSLLWAVSALSWWLVLFLPVLVVLTKRAAGPNH